MRTREQDVTMCRQLSYNTRFIQFGRKYKAFAKFVPSGKTVIYALQMTKKHLALLVAFR